MNSSIQIPEHADTPPPAPVAKFDPTEIHYIPETRQSRAGVVYHSIRVLPGRHPSTEPAHNQKREARRILSRKYGALSGRRWRNLRKTLSLLGVLKHYQGAQGAA